MYNIFPTKTPPDQSLRVSIRGIIIFTIGWISNNTINIFNVPNPMMLLKEKKISPFSIFKPWLYLIWIMSFHNFPLFNAGNMIRIMDQSDSNHDHFFYKKKLRLETWLESRFCVSKSPILDHDLNHKLNTFNFCYLIWIFSSLKLNHIVCFWLEINSHFSLFLFLISSTHINLFSLIFSIEPMITIMDDNLWYKKW